MTNFGILLFTLLCLYHPVFPQEKFNIADSINQFSISLLGTVNKQGGDNLNVALSPLTVWTMLSIINEGAADSTADELDKVLGQPQNKNSVRDSYGRLSKLLYKTKSNGVDFVTSTGIFNRLDYPVKEKFSRIVQQYYDASIKPVDFKNSNSAAQTINSYVSEATRGFIPSLVVPGDVQDAYLFMTSTMFFKAEWSSPFNSTATKREAFFDEKKMKIGEVQMMYTADLIPYDRVDALKADAIELRYGDGMFSMLVVVPRGAQTLANVLERLKTMSITNILVKMRDNLKKFSDDNIHVYLPKFKVSSDFNLDPVLEQMGVKDLFNPQKANLLGMFPHYLFLSRLIQKAEIEVDERGTVAAAAAGSVFENRMPPPVVRANRPFAYFIVHEPTGSVIFAGKVSNPSSLG